MPKCCIMARVGLPARPSWIPCCHKMIASSPCDANNDDDDRVRCCRLFAVLVPVFMSPAQAIAPFEHRSDLIRSSPAISAFVFLPPSVGRHLRGSLQARQHTRITGSSDHWEAWYFIELLGQDSTPELHVAVVLLLLNGFLFGRVDDPVDCVVWCAATLPTNFK